MPDSDFEPTAPQRRAAQRDRQRRQTRNRVISAVLAGILIIAAALWFSDTLRIPTDGPSFASGAVSDDTPTPDSTVAKPKAPAHRALTTADPMRLWIGGDSLAGALGPSLGDLTAATGIIQPQYDSRVGSGLLDGVGEIDWFEHAQEQLDELNPEVVVFIIGTNDANVYNDSQAEEYALLTERMMKLLIGDGRDVYWVNAPVMRSQNLEKGVLKVDEIQRSVASMFPDHVTFVDAHTLFADETGEYMSSLPDANGDNVQMRAGDGIHLSDAGGDHLAKEIFDLIDPRWRVTAQQVPSQPKKVLVTRGSETRPGSGGSSSGSGSSSNSSNSYRSNSSSSSNSGGSSGSGTTSTTSAPVAPPPPPSSTQPPATSTTTTPTSTPPSS